MLIPWKGYCSLTKNRPPRPLVVEALKYVNNKNICLDIGAGALNDSRFLLEEGFKKVVAVDSSADFFTFAKEISSENFIPINSPIEEYAFIPNQLDFVTAQFSLPFVSSKKNLDEIWNVIHDSLKKGGIFCGQLFGERDSWNDQKHKILFHSKKEIEIMVHAYKVLFLEEEEKESQTASGHEKHWHIFNFILEKVL